MKVIYEDNHLLVVYKEPGEIVQGDKTGDTPLSEHVKSYLKEKYNKPGNVFCGVVHRIDRPVAGLVIFARTSKALTRLNDIYSATGASISRGSSVPTLPMPSALCSITGSWPAATGIPSSK